MGYDPLVAEQLWNDEGFEAWYQYRKLFEARALAQAFRDHPDAIVEAEAAQAVYEDPSLLALVVRARPLALPMVRLLPSPDVEHTVEVLDAREERHVAGLPLNEYLVRNPSNRMLATLTVYTDGQTPEQTCDEILRRISSTNQSVILIGPQGAGKSTVAALLASALGRPEVELDSLRWGYYREVGYDAQEQARIAALDGFDGVFRYWKRFDLHAVARVLAEHPRSIIHFGAGHSVFDTPEEREQVKQLLTPYANVVLLLPSADPDVAIARLRAQRPRPFIGGVEYLRHLLTHPSNQTLATCTVYTDGKSPEQVRDAVIERLVLEGP
jgi:shikimate kinase